jgi:hypothetical protein
VSSEGRAALARLLLIHAKPSAPLQEIRRPMHAYLVHAGLWPREASAEAAEVRRRREARVRRRRRRERRLRAERAARSAAPKVFGLW